VAKKMQVAGRYTAAPSVLHACVSIPRFGPPALLLLLLLPIALRCSGTEPRPF
jgi:hypothetical protein